MVGGGYPVGGRLLYPVVAPALILVGTLMMGGVREIAWDDLTEAIPAFLTMVIMPLAVSITEGIAFGFIAYAILKLASGPRPRGAPAGLRVRGAVRRPLRFPVARSTPSCSLQRAAFRR